MSDEVNKDGNVNSILKELSDIKSSLAVNTTETNNIKVSITEIKTDIKDIKTKYITQDQLNVFIANLNEISKLTSAHDKDLTKIKSYGTIGLILLGIIQFIIGKYF